MWNEVRSLPIVGLLESLAAEQEHKAEDGALSPEQRAVAEAVRAGLLAQVAKRKEDQRFWLKVRHVGGPDDPFRFEALKAEHERAVHEARARARKELAEAGEDITEQSVSDALARDPAWQLRLGALIKAWFEHGVENGAAEYARVWSLGCEALGGARGGSTLLLHAWWEIRRAQEIDAPLA